MKTEDCSKIFKIHYYYDPESGKNVKGYVIFHCHHNNCHDKHCTNERVGKAFERFKNAFSGEIYYKDFEKHTSLSYKDIQAVGYKLFKEILILDCFTFFRLIVSHPRNNLVDLTQFIHIKKWERFLWRSMEACKISPEGLIDNTEGRHIFYRNIHKNPKVKRIPTVDTHFVKEFKGEVPEKERGKRVKFSLPEDVRFKVYDGQFKMVGIQEALQNNNYKWFCETIHGFDFTAL